MNHPVDKHLPYYGLLESLQNAEGCALCQMRDRRSRRYLENLLYENVNDAGLQNELIRSRGLCGHHAKILLSLGDGLGIAILYQNQVAMGLAFLERLGRVRERRLRRRAILEWDKHGQCPACALQDQDEELRIGTLLDSLRDPAMRQALERSPGLCIPHLLKVLAADNEVSTHQYLVDLHRSKLVSLLDELKEFCRRHDYRHSHEKLGEEADSWRRAVEMLVGDRDERR